MTKLILRSAGHAMFLCKEMAELLAASEDVVAACPGVVRRCLISDQCRSAADSLAEAGKFDIGLHRELVLNLLGKGESWLFAKSAGVADSHDNS